MDQQGLEIPTTKDWTPSDAFRAAVPSLGSNQTVWVRYSQQTRTSDTFSTSSAREQSLQTWRPAKTSLLRPHCPAPAPAGHRPTSSPGPGCCTRAQLPCRRALTRRHDSEIGPAPEQRRTTARRRRGCLYTWPATTVPRSSRQLGVHRTATTGNCQGWAWHWHRSSCGICSGGFISDTHVKRLLDHWLRDQLRSFADRASELAAAVGVPRKGPARTSSTALPDCPSHRQTSRLPRFTTSSG